MSDETPQLETNITTTVDLTTWNKAIINQSGLTSLLEYSDNHSRIILDAASYLAPIITAYMLEAVAQHNGQELTAKTIQVTDIAEFKKSFGNLNDMVFLYMPIWVPPSPQFYQVNIDTSEAESLDIPTITAPYWMIRYAVLNNTNV